MAEAPSPETERDQNYAGLATPSLGYAQGASPNLQHPSRSPVPLALKLFSSSSASSNTQKSGPARFPLSFPSPHLSPPPYHHSSLLPLNLQPACPARLWPSHPICPCVYSACVCVCVCSCACVRLHQLRQDQACQVGCFLFCASTPRRSTHLHRAERELEVQRARDTGDGSTLPTPASPPSKQQHQHQAAEQSAFAALLHIGTLPTARPPTEPGRSRSRSPACGIVCLPTTRIQRPPHSFPSSELAPKPEHCYLLQSHPPTDLQGTACRPSALLAVLLSGTPTEPQNHLQFQHWLSGLPELLPGPPTTTKRDS